MERGKRIWRVQGIERSARLGQSAGQEELEIKGGSRELANRVGSS